MEFVPSAASLLYAARADDGTVSRAVLYLLPSGTTDPPPALSFDDAWTGNAGWYFFLGADLATGLDQAFADAAWTMLTDPRATGVRFVWAQPYDGTAPLAGTWLATYVPAGTQVPLTAHLVDFSLGSVDVLLPMSSTITTDPTAGSFSFAPPSGQAVQVTAGWGATAAGSVTGALSTPLTGAGAGTLRFPLALDLDDQTALDAGLRWFYADAFSGSAGPADGDDPFFLTSYRYPVLAQAVTVYAQLHPLAPFDATRSYLAFTASDAGQQGPAPGALDSYYSSTLGDRFTVTPLSGSAAPTTFASLVLAPNPRASEPSPGDPVYFVPQGDFSLGSTRSGPVDLMCGLSGVEHVTLPGNGQTLSFVPGKPAYAHGFAPGQPPGDGPVPAVAPTTSYAAVTGPATVLGYYAQPDQSVLYNYPPSAAGGAPAGVQATLLQAVQVLAASVPALPPAGGDDARAYASTAAAAAPVSYPLLPYAGVGGEPVAGYGQLESQVVSPARRVILRAQPPQPQLHAATATGPGSTSAYSTTPQGLLASGVGTTTWGRVVLAQMPDQGSAQGPQLALSNVGGDLLSAFQSNKMFLVATDPTALAPYLAAADAQLLMGSDPTEPWRFDLTPANWSQHGTVFILKFYDQTIIDLVKRTSMWSFPKELNVDAAETSRRLQQILADVDPSDPDFAALWAAVNEPGWNGVLALNVVAPLNELPPQLAGLAVGIDKSKFCAHHVGIAASKIDATPGSDIKTKQSSMFGLIDYRGPAALPGGQLAYQFSVQQLTVLFLASDVASFACIIELQVNQLFGEPSKLTGSTDNVVRLYGSFDKHVSGSVVQESYSFQTKAGVPSDFDMTSQVLNAVELSRGQFATVTTASSASLTEAQFIFWGLLDFTALKGFDALSFGREADATSPAGLSFGNLVITMTFDPQDAKPVPIFDFDASQLSFDLAGSKPRESSFYRHFPLTLSAFTQAETGATPTSLGYMGVQTPLNQSSLEYPWYSLDLDLNLGSAGALAARAGFVATLTIAWTPGGTDYSVFTGLKLPGSNGSKRAITIEGLFDISFKTLQIIALPNDVYVLVLYGIGFTFLSFTFPPTGQVDFALFGDPRAANGGASLGWYAAYAKPDTTKKQPAALPGTTR
ncbi:MAG: hypothetical protein ACJ74O_04960 [Frankiaceae bacterium]